MSKIVLSERMERLAKIIPDMRENIHYWMEHRGLSEDEVIVHFVHFYQCQVQECRESIDEMRRTGRKPNDAMGTLESNMISYKRRYDRYVRILDEIVLEFSEGGTR